MTDCKVTAGREGALDEGLHSSNDLDPILECEENREGNQDEQMPSKA